MDEQVTVRQVALNAAEAMIAMGQSPISVWREFYPVCMKIVHFYERKQLEYYDPIITAEYSTAVLNRYEKNEIARGTHNFHRKTAERMDEVFYTGRIQWSYRSRHRREPLNPYFTELHTEYLHSKKFHHNTREDISWVLHKHLLWLMNKGHSNFSTVTEGDISKYITHCVRQLKPSSLGNLISYTRRFYEFLSEKGETDIYYEGFLSISFRRPEKIQTPATPDEVESVLKQINRATPVGKRDYAMILLGARIGLRAADVVCLKLKDIDWRMEQIRLCQQKTGKEVLLPLPTDVADALKEYILRVRPDSEYEQVFLRILAPFQPLSAGAALSYSYNKYLEKAGYKRKAFDGRGFHSLRRMLGKEMTVAGIPATTVAQVLGHQNIDTVKQYISLDTVHLKECALDFQGIELTGEVMS